MKTILSIFEAIMFNLLPPELVAHLSTFFKNIIPLIGLVLVRIYLLLAISCQRAGNWINLKVAQLTGIPILAPRLRLKEQT